MVSPPQLVTADHRPRGALLWRFDPPVAALSSAAVGGGRGPANWVINLGVTSDYARTDLAAHADELAVEHGLVGPGIMLFTATDITRRRRREVDGVTVHATVGVSEPTWAAEPPVPAIDEPHPPGTINLVVELPVVLDDGAAVNAVMTATEAKTQALLEHGIAGTGTASDAVVILWPQPPDAAVAPGTGRDQAAARFAGPRSWWGSRLAIAVHGAVRAGLETP